MVMVGIAAAVLALIAWIMASIEDWYCEWKSKSDGSSTKSVQPALENN